MGGTVKCISQQSSTLISLKTHYPHTHIVPWPPLKPGSSKYFSNVYMKLLSAAAISFGQPKHALTLWKLMGITHILLHWSTGNWPHAVYCNLTHRYSRIFKLHNPLASLADHNGLLNKVVKLNLWIGSFCIQSDKEVIHECMGKHIIRSINTFGTCTQKVPPW